MTDRIKAHVRMIDDARDELEMSANIITDMAESYLDDPYFKECKKEFLRACEEFSRCIDNAPRNHDV